MTRAGLLGLYLTTGKLEKIARWPFMCNHVKLKLHKMYVVWLLTVKSGKLWTPLICLECYGVARKKPIRHAKLNCKNVIKLLLKPVSKNLVFKNLLGLRPFLYKNLFNLKFETGSYFLKSIINNNNNNNNNNKHLSKLGQVSYRI